MIMTGFGVAALTALDVVLTIGSGRSPIDSMRCHASFVRHLAGEAAANRANSSYVRTAAVGIWAAYTAGSAILFAADLPKRLAETLK